MPSPIVALDLIKTAMRYIGVIAVGETPSADDANLGLQALNDVIESWSLESLAVLQNNVDALTTTAAKSTYSVGPGGDFDIPRPIRIDQLYLTVQGVDFPISEWTLAQYDAVGIKTLQQQIVERFVYLNTDPLGTLILYPVPQLAVPIYIDAPRILDNVPSLATTLTLAPGYARALGYAVAVEMTPQFGATIDVGAQARATKALIKRANRTPQIANFDSTLLGRRPGVMPWTW